MVVLPSVRLAGPSGTSNVAVRSLGGEPRVVKAKSTRERETARYSMLTSAEAEAENSSLPSNCACRYAVSLVPSLGR